VTNSFSLIGVDPAKVPVALHDLSQVLGQSIETQELKAWAMQAKLGSSVFAQMIAGSIVWKKILGRPSSAKMRDGLHHGLHDGFDVRIRQEKQVQDLKTGYLITVDGDFFPSTWDASQEEEQYRVNFLFFGQVTGPLKVMVTFKEPPKWEVDALSEVGRHRLLQPGVRPVVKDAGQALIVEPFEVISLSHGNISASNP
jgi:hypothetical protein